MPKNSPMGLIIASFAFLFGFCMIWHIYWLLVVSLLSVVVLVITRTSDDDNEYVVTAAQIEEIETKRVASPRKRYA
jgi:cytochrome o ubiquinol oxidase subunit 1